MRSEEEIRAEAIEEAAKVADKAAAKAFSDGWVDSGHTARRIADAIRSLVSDDKERGSPSEDAGPV